MPDRARHNPGRHAAGPRHRSELPHARRRSHPRSPPLSHLRRQPTPAAQGHYRYRHCRQPAPRPKRRINADARRRLHALPHSPGPFQPGRPARWRDCTSSGGSRDQRHAHLPCRLAAAGQGWLRSPASSTPASTRPAAISPSTSPPAKATDFCSGSMAAFPTIRSTSRKAPPGPSRPPPPSIFPRNPLPSPHRRSLQPHKHHFWDQPESPRHSPPPTLARGSSRPTSPTPQL